MDLVLLQDFCVLAEAFGLSSEMQGGHKSTPVIEHSSSHVHINVHTCGCTQKYWDMKRRPSSGQIINAASQYQARSNAQHSTHI